MKKVLATGAALLMAGSIATAAEMDDKSGVKISGNARARVIYKDSYDFGNTNKDANVTMDSRVRFDVRGTSAGGSYIHGRIRLAEEKFDGATSAAADNNIYVDKAYIGIPFTDTFILEAGKYRVSYGKGFMYDDIGLAGLRGVYKTDDVLFVPFLETISEGQSSDNVTDVMEDNDSYRIGATVSGTVGEGWNIGALAAFQTDDRAETDGTTGDATGAGDNDGFFGSVFATGTMGAFGLETEIAYAEEGLSDFTAGSDDSGWGGYVRGSWNMDALTLALDLGWAIDGFTPDPFYGFVMIGGEEPIGNSFGKIGSGGADNYWAGLRVGYAVSESLSLTGNLVYLDADGNDVVGIDESRLYDLVEVSGVLKYAVSKGCTFSWYAGYLSPSFDGRVDAAGVKDDGAFGTYAKFDVSF